MQQQDVEQNPSPPSAQSNLSTTAETNGHSLLPNKVDDQDNFTFDAYSHVPYAATGDELKWGNPPWKGQGVARRDPSTKRIRWDWKGPKTHLGRVSEVSFSKDSANERAVLRKQTTMDGSKSRYVQTFGRWDSNLPDNKRYPNIAGQLLVGRWYDNPTLSFPSSHSSAEKDDDPNYSSPKEEEEEPVENDCVDVPGHKWETVYKTGHRRDFLRPPELQYYFDDGSGYRDPSRDCRV